LIVMPETDWPVAAGVYVLLFELPAALTVTAGRLGPITLTPGRYAYVGSARGPAGLRGRLARHLRRQKRLHWHIDYLTQCAPVRAVYWQVAAEPLECRWAQALQRLPGATLAAVGFGSSDCRAGCRSHLIRLPDGFDGETLPALLSALSAPGECSDGR
jgi:Uri superfamily endonuclease